MAEIFIKVVNVLFLQCDDFSLGEDFAMNVNIFLKPSGICELILGGSVLVKGWNYINCLKIS